MWVRLTIFSQLSIIQYVGLCVFSLPIISFVMVERIYMLCLIIIIKSETCVWTITHCLGLGHETMVCAVCLSIFLWTSSFILCTWHESRYILHSSNCHKTFGHIFCEYIYKRMTFIFQFSARVSDYTNFINGLNTIHGYQSCVWYMAYDVWRKIYLWENELASLFPIKPVPLMWVFENILRKYITC